MTKRWKDLLPPLAAALAVLVLALLPQKLSRVRDAALEGAVHPEALREDSNFPAKPPELPGRARLLGKNTSGFNNFTSMYQSLEGAELEEAAAQASKAMAALEEAGVLPPGAVPDPGDFYTGDAWYLRDQTDLSSAGFWELHAYSPPAVEYLQLFLDRESGEILALELLAPALSDWEQEALETGGKFLNRLGLEYTWLDGAGRESVFCLEDGETMYYVRRPRDGLDILPRWEGETDLSNAAVYDVAKSGG